MAGPLDGVRVLDLTSMISGPLASMMLADQGADVIKVENPTGGDFTRHVATTRGGFSASFVNNNRNKRSVIIDLKSAEGIDTLGRLAQSADVMLQNFRPGVADRIGIGEKAMRTHNQRIIYVSICGYGFDGPFAQKPVFDPLIQATSGLTTVQAGSDETRPRLVRTILPDKLTGIQASQAITAALFARERTGQGQHIQLSMLDTVVFFLWSSDMGGHTFVGDEMEKETAQSFIDLIYETRDGYVSIAVMQDKTWAGLSRAIDRPDFLEDERFKTAELRDLNKDERTQLIQDAVRDFQTEPLINRLEDQDVPCCQVLRRKDMISHPQIVANETLVNYEHPSAGLLRQARQPASFSVTPADTFVPAPAYGEHTRQVLLENGFCADDITRLIKAGVVRDANERED